MLKNDKNPVDELFDDLEAHPDIDMSEYFNSPVLEGSNGMSTVPTILPMEIVGLYRKSTNSVEDTLNYLSDCKDYPDLLLRMKKTIVHNLAVDKLKEHFKQG